MIRVQNLEKTFGTFTAVNDVSFDVAEGEIFAFLGPNGAGKTTTIKMLTTLLQPTRGTIQLDGLDPRTNQNEVRKRFGICVSRSQPGWRSDGERKHGDSRGAVSRAPQGTETTHRGVVGNFSEHGSGATIK